MADAKSARSASSDTGRFTAEERAAMKDRAKELKGGGDGEAEVRAKIAEMSDADRVIAERIHEIVQRTAPHLTPRLWYGQQAYAKNGNTVIFFQNSGKFKTRYSTLGFNEEATLDDGEMWPTAFAILKLTPAVEARIIELVKKAAG